MGSPVPIEGGGGCLFILPISGSFRKDTLHEPSSIKKVTRGTATVSSDLVSPQIASWLL